MNFISRIVFLNFIFQLSTEKRHEEFAQVEFEQHDPVRVDIREVEAETAVPSRMRRPLHGRLVTRWAEGTTSVRRWTTVHSNSLECPVFLLHPTTTTTSIVDDVILGRQSQPQRQSLFLHSISFDTSSTGQLPRTGRSIPLNCVKRILIYFGWREKAKKRIRR